MLRVILSGCNGQMGQVVSQMISEKSYLEVVAGLDRDVYKHENSYPVFANLSKFTDQADLVIDFSHPSLLSHLLEICLERNLPLVSATTGLTANQLKDLRQAAEVIPIFYSANMSVGINLLIKVIKQATTILHDTFDIEIIEKHHNRKVDAPSGTAFMLANAVNETLDQSRKLIFGREGEGRRDKQDLGIHAVRGGTIAGEHTVIFAGEDEVLELKHSALSKKVFGAGALRAAEFVIHETCGFYTMDDLLRSSEDLENLILK